MANHMTSPPDINFINCQRTPSSSSSHLTTPANYTSITALRTRLSTISPSYYTEDRLNSMSVNDMVYSLRLAEDANTFSGNFSNGAP